MNTLLWYHHFALPMVRFTLREVENGTFMADRDMGEMFLKSMLSEEVRLLCAVYMRNVQTE